MRGRCSLDMRAAWGNGTSPGLEQGGAARCGHVGHVDAHALKQRRGGSGAWMWARDSMQGLWLSGRGWTVAMPLRWMVTRDVLTSGLQDTLPQASWLNVTHMYYLAISVGRYAGTGSRGVSGGVGGAATPPTWLRFSPQPTSWVSAAEALTFHLTAACSQKSLVVPRTVLSSRPALCPLRPHASHRGPTSSGIPEKLSCHQLQKSVLLKGLHGHASPT